MRKVTLLFLLIIPFIGYAQVDEPTSTKNFGVGIGYNFHSVMSDSIRPLELSLHYRIDDRHKLHLFTPVAYQKTDIRDADDTRKKTLWGVGAGYDYTFYKHSFLSFFVGIESDYQWYQNRRDLHTVYYEIENNEISNEVDWTYYDWIRIKGLSVQPNSGVRFNFNKVTAEFKFGLMYSSLRHKKYSYSKKTRLNSSNAGEMYYPEEHKDIHKFQPSLSLNLLYYF